MKALDLTKQLKPFKNGWVALNNRNEVVANAKTINAIAKKIIGKKNITLIPAAESYKGYIT